MIQRIQTLYLFVVVVLGITLLWLPVVQFVTPEDSQTLRIWELSAVGLEEITNVEAEPVQMQGLWGLTIATLLIPILALVDIFLYKKRLHQARLNIFTVMLCIGYYGVLAIYIYLATMIMEVEWHIFMWASIPLINIILTLMATRRILKDEALVRAADRIR